MGSRPFPFKGKNQSFPPSRTVICSFHSVCMSKYGHYKAKAQESVLNSGATNKAFFILGSWRSGNKYVAMVTTITMCSSCNTSTLQNFNPVDLVLAQIFHILLFYITLCPQCDITSHLNCINQYLE